MSEVWYCIPSAAEPDKANACLRKWKARGYRTAVFRDAGAASVDADMVIFGAYEGYAVAVNRLMRAVLAAYPDVQWLVTGGDDMDPEPNVSPQIIANECTWHFNGTLGIMQPTGDRHMLDETGRSAAERVCISPWIGAEWVRRGFGGRGPLHPGFYHMFVDEHLHCVAKKLGILWHRLDLTHYHEHWTRTGSKPAYLDKASATWGEGKELFEAERAAGFPNCEPL